MNSRIIPTAILIAIMLISLVSLAYVSEFGLERSSSHHSWAEFGEYFGGILNPLFAMLAFFAVLWSISLQKDEFRRASDHLANQSQTLTSQLHAQANEQLSQELLHVIRDIDSRIELILKTVISTPGSDPSITISLLVAEAERVAQGADYPPAYLQFIAIARTPGSVVEAHIRDVAHLIGEMRSFLEQMSSVRPGSYAPVILYYANKVLRLLPLLEGVGCVPVDSRQFFATVGDPHH